MNKKLFIQFAKKVLKLAEVTIGDKTYYVEGDIVEGAELLDENGEVLADGEYEIAIGDEKMNLVIEDGKVKTATKIEIEVEQKEVQEPEQQPTEKDEKDLKIEELEGLLKDRDAIIEELNQKIKELEDAKKAPVDDPIKMNKVNEEKVVKNGALKYFE